jgi:hypothetical protein
MDLGKSDRPDSIALNLIGYVHISAVSVSALDSRIQDFGDVPTKR